MLELLTAVQGALELLMAVQGALELTWMALQLGLLSTLPLHPSVPQMDQGEKAKGGCTDGTERIHRDGAELREDWGRPLRFWHLRSLQARKRKGWLH